MNLLDDPDASGEGVQQFDDEGEVELVGDHEGSVPLDGSFPSESGEESSGSYEEDEEEVRAVSKEDEVSRCPWFLDPIVIAAYIHSVFFQWETVFIVIGTVLLGFSFGPWSNFLVAWFQPMFLLMVFRHDVCDRRIHEPEEDDDDRDDESQDSEDSDGEVSIRRRQVKMLLHSRSGVKKAEAAVRARWRENAVTRVLLQWLCPKTLLFFMSVFCLQCVTLLPCYYDFTRPKKLENSGDSENKGLYVLLFLYSSLLLIIQYSTDRLFIHYLRRFAFKNVSWVYILPFPMAGAALSSLFILFSPVFNISLGNVAMPVHSQMEFLPILQVVAIVGPTGLYFVMCLFASGCSHLWLRFDELRARLADREGGIVRIRRIVKDMRATFILIVVMLCLVLFLGSFRVTMFSPHMRGLSSVNIGSITPSLKDNNRELQIDAYAGKRDSDQLKYRDRNLEELFEESSRLAEDGTVPVVFWCEKAIALFDDEVEQFLNRSSQWAKDYNAYLGVAYLEIDFDRCADHSGHSQCSHNLFVFYQPDGTIGWRYDKRHPVPGAEDNIIAGSKSEIPAVDTPYGRIGGVICYDLDFPLFMTKAGRNSIDILLAPSSDWPEIHFHTKWDMMRAVEGGYCLIRQTRNTISMAVDQHGSVLSFLDQEAENSTYPHVMVTSAPNGRSTSAYSWSPEVFGLLCGLLLFVVALEMIVTGLGRRLALLRRELRRRQKERKESQLMQIDKRTMSFLDLTTADDGDGEAIAWNSESENEEAAMLLGGDDDDDEEL